MNEREDVRVLAIAGSLREQSFNKALLRAAAEDAPPGISVTIYEGLTGLPLFNDDVAEAGVPSGVAHLRESVAASDGLLIATPEYNQAVPGVVKNMIDWLSLGEPPASLEAKPVAVTGVTTGPWGTRLAQTMLRQMLLSCQAVALPTPNLYVRDARSIFDGEGRLIDLKVRNRVGELVDAFSEWIRLVGSRQSSVLSCQ